MAYNIDDETDTHTKPRRGLFYSYKQDKSLSEVEHRINSEALQRGALDVEQINWEIYDRTGKIVPIKNK